MTQVSRYILKQLLTYAAGIIAAALAALLLERMLRLLDLTVNSDSVLGYVSGMLLTLLPHYLGIAVPVAFFLATLLTVNKLCRQSEMAVLNAAGWSYGRLMRPVLALALVITAIVVLMYSYVQPYSRYTYRTLVHAVSYQSLNAALKAGAFVTVDDMTFMAEGRSLVTNQLENVFVYKQEVDGSSVVTTAPLGRLMRQTEEDETQLALVDGHRTEFTAEGGIDRQLGFETFLWPVQGTGFEPFRMRGDDERELTLPELWNAYDAPPPQSTTDHVRAELHGRLVKMLTIMVLPFLAFPLGLSNNRTGQFAGVMLGVVILVVYDKAVEMGAAMTALGSASPWFAIWLPFVLMTSLAALLFSAINAQPFTEPTQWLASGFESAAKAIRRQIDRLRVTRPIAPQSRVKI